MQNAHESVDRSDERLRRWSRVFNPAVVVAAIVPLGAIAYEEGDTSGPGALVAFVCWLVFAVDFGARSVLSDGFIRTWRGRLYAVIVVITFPVYVLVPAWEETDLLAVSRLGWIAVLAMSGFEGIRATRQLIRRVGFAGLGALAAVFVSAMVVYRVEDRTDGFDTVGDSLWWAMATITTVGYGDRVPETASGRAMATLLMLSGLAFLGVVAASLASYFGLDDGDDTPDESAATTAPVIEEIRALRDEVARLTAVVGRLEARQAPPGGEVADEGSG